MMEPPLCFLLLLGVERVQVNLLGGLTDGHENMHSPRPWGVFKFVAETGTEALSRENGDREAASVCWAFQAEEPLSHA